MRAPFFYVLALAVAMLAWRRLPVSDPGEHAGLGRYVRNLLASAYVRASSVASVGQ